MRGFFASLQQVDESIPHLFKGIRSAGINRGRYAYDLVTVIAILLFGVPFCLPPNFIPVLFIF